MFWVNYLIVNFQPDESIQRVYQYGRVNDSCNYVTYFGYVIKKCQQNTATYKTVVTTTVIVKVPCSSSHSPNIMQVVNESVHLKTVFQAVGPASALASIHSRPRERDGRVVSVTGLGSRGCGFESRCRKKWWAVMEFVNIYHVLVSSYVNVCVRLLFRFVLIKLRHYGHLELSSSLTFRAKLVLYLVELKARVTACQSFVFYYIYTVYCCPTLQLVWCVIVASCGCQLDFNKDLLDLFIHTRGRGWGHLLEAEAAKNWPRGRGQASRPNIPAPSFKRHNLVNIRFIWMKISDNIAEGILSLKIWKSENNLSFG